MIAQKARTTSACFVAESIHGLHRSPFAGARDFVARRVAPGSTTDRLRITQGVIAITATSTDGLAVLTLTEDGYFLREMIPASPTLRQKLLAGG